MGLETATYINELNPSFPLFNDFIREADDHMRLIKSTIQNSFPNITGAMNATQAELNLLVGVTAFPLPGGLDTHVQFNSSGAFQGSSNLVFDGSTLTALQINITGLTTLGIADTMAEGVARVGDVGSSFFSGGSSQILGAAITLYGSTHATLANDMSMAADGTPFMGWDNSAAQLNITPGLTSFFNATQVGLGNFVFDIDQTVGPATDNFFFAYDDGTGEIRLVMAPAGSGNVQNTGVPLNDQIAVWTNSSTIEGDPNLTFDGILGTFTASDGTSQLQWQGDQLALYNNGDIYFEALQGETNLWSGDMGDPTAADPIETRLFWLSQEQNQYGYMGFNSNDELELVSDVWGGEFRYYGRTAAGVLGSALSMKFDECEVTLCDGDNAPVTVEGSTGGSGTASGALFIKNGATIYTEDIVSPQINLGAGNGQWWSRLSDGAPMFTDGLGNDFQLNGASVSPDYNVVFENTTSRTAAAYECILANDTVAAGIITITLPPSVIDDQIIVKKVGSSFNVIVDGDAAETIDGALTFALTAQYSSVTLIADGTGWNII